MSDFNVRYVVGPTEQEKLEMVRFVYDNTDTFVMNTFGLIWSRCPNMVSWWDLFPIVLAKDGDQIIGLHAYSFNHKGPDVIKTYYIVTDKGYSGKGIASGLILKVLNDYSDVSSKYYVNSEINSLGVGFFKKLLKMEPTIIDNEFGTKDAVFEKTIKDILDEQAV
jgi:hypothetical protein